MTSVCANINWRLQSEASEVMTVPGPIAALFAPLWLAVPRSLLLSYSSLPSRGLRLSATTTL